VVIYNFLTGSKLRLILLLSVVLRVAAAFYLGDSVAALPGTADQVSYHNLALRVLAGHGFSFGEVWWPATDANEPTAHWSYLYTLFLTAVYFVFGPHPLAARLIQAVIVGLLQPYLAYRLAGLLFNTDAWSTRVRANTPLLAAAITAIYVYFIYYAAALMTEAFFVCGLLASLTLAIALAGREPGSAYAKTAIALGVALSATVLLRQLFLLLIPFLFLWLVVAAYRGGSWKRALPAIALALAVLVLSIAPFTAYNYARFNRFVLLNTNAGYAFFWANHPIYGTEFVDANEMGDTYQRLVPDELRHLDEAGLDQELLKRGLQFVRDDPVRYVKLSLSRIPDYFKFWPDSDSGLISNFSRIASFALFMPFMLYGLLFSLVTIGRRANRSSRLSPSLLVYLVIFVYTAIHVLTWTQIRYRIPIDAVLVIFAALAIVELVRLGSKLFSKSGSYFDAYDEAKHEKPASS
jgi:4-amino-4-deoxy-L-arabinose transferase-like glycosyltransferase